MLTTSWDLLTPLEGIRQYSEGKAESSLSVFPELAAASPELSGPAQATELMNLGAGAGHSVLTCSQVILITG